VGNNGRFIIIFAVDGDFLASMVVIWQLPNWHNSDRLIGMLIAFVYPARYAINLSTWYLVDNPMDLVLFSRFHPFSHSLSLTQSVQT